MQRGNFDIVIPGKAQAYPVLPVAKIREIENRVAALESLGAFRIETPAETPDDSRTTFTVVNTPRAIIVNGLIYFVSTGLFSSYSSGTITLSGPVGTGGFIRSIY